MTAQVHERLIYEGEVTSMAFSPPLPRRDKRIRLLRDDEIERGKSIAFTTACWRGYIGTWEIKDGRFYLVWIEGRYRMTGDTPIFADWFSGVLRVPKGKRIHYVHMGFGSVYEEEIHVKIKKGVAVKTQLIDNRGKEFNKRELAWNNLPGSENRFDGDEE